jgi:hypothetical protein
MPVDTTPSDGPAMGHLIGGMLPKSRFGHVQNVLAYSGVFWQIEQRFRRILAYSGVVCAYSGVFWQIMADYGRLGFVKNEHVKKS